MAAETVDTLELEIRSKGTSAALGVDALASSVRLLGRSVSSYMGSLKDFAATISQIAQSVKGIGKISSLKTMASEMSKAAKAAEKLNEVSDASAQAKKNTFYPVTTEAENAARRAATRPQWNEWKEQVNRGVEKAKADAAIEQDTIFKNNLKMLTPERIRAEREAQSARALPQWERFRGEDIRHAADEGLKRGFIDESTAQAMKDATQSASEGMNQVKDEADGAAGKMREFGEAEKTASRNGMGLAGSLKNIGHLLGHSIIGQLFRVAKMRALRYAVRAVVSGFKEGIQNMYQWSKQVGGDFATSMDTAASKVMYMKNSLGTALAPVIQALIPVLTTIVNWIHTASNAIAQFFALLNGKNSWTKAVETAEKFGDQQKKNSKKTKDLLADWDELNIIQSKNEDSGGSGTTQYSKMFEEVTEFDEKIKGVTKVIQENFDKIKDIALEIGAVIVGWKLSETLIAGISQLAGLFVAIGIAKIVFDVTWFTANKYLETKETGWLVLDFLTPLIGSTLAYAILNKVLGGMAAEISVPIIFAVSAVADVTANIGKTDVSSLSEESLALSFEASLKTAVIGGWIGKMVGGTLMSVVEGGTIGLITGFGIAIGLKADAQVLANGLTKEDIAAKAGSAVMMATGGALAGAKAVKYGLISGTATAAAAKGAMLFGGLPIATFGIAIGINAVNKVVDAREITSDTVKQNLISAGLTAAGVFISTAAIFGAGVGFVAAGGAALLTVGTLFAIEAYIESKPVKIEWGDKKMTTAAVQNWVYEHMFRFDLRTQINIAGEKAQVTISKKQDLIASAQKALGILPIIKVGMAKTDDAYFAELDQAVSDIVTAYQTYRQARKEELALAFSIVPIRDNEGNVVTSAYMEGIETGWTAVDDAMTKLGTKLAGLISEAFNKELAPQAREDAMNAVLRYTEEMAKATALITASQAQVKMEHEFGAGLEGVDRTSVSAIIDYYNEQKSGTREFIEKEYEKILSESETLLGIYQGAIEEAEKSEDGKFLDKTAAEWKELYDSQTKIYEGLKEARERSVEAALEFYEGDGKGKQMIRDAIMEAVKQQTLSEDALVGITSTPYFAGGEWLRDEEIEEGKVTELLEEIIRAAYGTENYELLKNAIDIGVIGWGDLISKETMLKLAEQLGLDENVNPKLRESFWTMISGFFGDESESSTEIRKWALENAEEAKKAVQEAVEEVVEAKPEASAETKPAYAEDKISAVQVAKAELQKVWELDASVYELVYNRLVDEYSQEVVNMAIDEIWDEIEGKIEDELEEEPLEVQPEIDVKVKPEYGEVDVELPDEEDEPSGVFHRPVWKEPEPEDVLDKDEMEDIILSNFADMWYQDDDTFDERYDALVEEYGKELVHQMYLKFKEGLKNGDEYIMSLFDLEGKNGIPGGAMSAGTERGNTGWFRGTDGRNGLVVDTKASGAATDKSVENLTGTMDMNMAEQERLTTEGNRILTGMQALLRTIAGREPVVNVVANSGFGRAVENGLNNYRRVTG